MVGLLRRRFLGGVCLVCLASAGCMQTPFYLPEFNVLPSVQAGCAGGEVHAFRVDVTDRMELKEGPGPNYVVRGENQQLYELTRIQPSPAGATPQQIKVSCATGWCYFGFFNNITSYTSHSVALRLYRPGFETIELKPGQNVQDLGWHEAADLAAQEKAIDDLLGMSPLDHVDPKSPLQQRQLEPGRKSTAQRDTLRFAVGEYERLARSESADVTEEMRGRLEEKTQRLKALASGGQTNGR